MNLFVPVFPFFSVENWTTSVDFGVGLAHIREPNLSVRVR